MLWLASVPPRSAPMLFRSYRGRVVTQLDAIPRLDGAGTAVLQPLSIERLVARV